MCFMIWATNITEATLDDFFILVPMERKRAVAKGCGFDGEVLRQEMGLTLHPKNVICKMCHMECRLLEQ